MIKYISNYCICRLPAWTKKARASTSGTYVHGTANQGLGPIGRVQSSTPGGMGGWDAAAGRLAGQSANIAMRADVAATERLGFERVRDLDAAASRLAGWPEC